MSIQRALVCDGCGVVFDTEISGAKEARREAAKDGWVYHRGTLEWPTARGVYDDVCPECQPQATAEGQEADDGKVD